MMLVLTRLLWVGLLVFKKKDEIGKCLDRIFKRVLFLKSRWEFESIIAECLRRACLENKPQTTTTI